MTDDFFRSRLDGMIDPRHPLAVLGDKLPWSPEFDIKMRFLVFFDFRS